MSLTAIDTSAIHNRLYESQVKQRNLRYSQNLMRLCTLVGAVVTIWHAVFSRQKHPAHAIGYLAVALCGISWRFLNRNEQAMTRLVNRLQHILNK